MTIVASRGSDKFVLRLPDGLRDEIKEAAKANGRSMNAEIVSRLQGSGKTLRDEFAGHAMAALIQSTEPRAMGITYEEFVRRTAQSAYEYADAMLAARQSQEGEDE